MKAPFLVQHSGSNIPIIKDMGTPDFQDMDRMVQSGVPATVHLCQLRANERVCSVKHIQDLVHFGRHIFEWVAITEFSAAGVPYIPCLRLSFTIGDGSTEGSF